MGGGGPMRVVAALLVAVVLVAAAGCGSRSSAPDPVTRHITIHYSRFEPTTLSVPHGVPVTIVLVNQDPIGHEWLIGDEAFHQRHRDGTEAVHAERPNEVFIPPLGRAVTTLTFDEAGTQLYVCHLPGHEAYGMVGTLTVT